MTTKVLAHALPHSLVPSALTGVAAVQETLFPHIDPAAEVVVVARSFLPSATFVALGLAVIQEARPPCSCCSQYHIPLLLPLKSMPAALPRLATYHEPGHRRDQE